MTKVMTIEVHMDGVRFTARTIEPVGGNPIVVESPTAHGSVYRAAKSIEEVAKGGRNPEDVLDLVREAMSSDSPPYQVRDRVKEILDA